MPILIDGFPYPDPSDGGPEPTWRDVLAGIAIVLLVVGLAVLVAALS